MSSEPDSQFHDDIPRENPWRHDRLGFRPFAERLAKVILRLKVPNGYVIGMHGEWGAGKSTAINFVKAFLDKHNQESELDFDKVVIVDFQPWIVSGHQDLVAAFFKVLSESLETKADRRWQRFQRAVGIARDGSEQLIEAVAKVAVISDPSGGPAAGAAAAVTKGSMNRALDRFLATPSLQASYEGLRAKLQRSKRRFLVTIDDLDRLQDEEIRSILQMVKTVGRLPHVIYLLAYDRAKISTAIGETIDDKGPKFTDKIIQQELDLPRPTRHSLLSLLDDELDFIAKTDVSSVRWAFIVRDGIQRWIRHPRDVLRLANATKFSWPALQGEVDAQDLVAVEGLRLFEPKIFDWVRWNRDFLFSDGRFSMASDGEQAAAVKMLKEQVPPAHQEETFRVLAVLFPSKGKHFEAGHPSSTEAHSEVTKRRGIGSASGYDAYFQLHPSADVVSKAVIEDIFRTEVTSDFITGILRSAAKETNVQGHPKIGALLEELKFNLIGRNPKPARVELLVALLQTGDEILEIEWRGDLFISAPRYHLTWLIRAVLERWSKAEAGRILSETYARHSPLVLGADIFLDRGGELGLVSWETHNEPVIDRADFEKFGQLLLRRIEAAAADGSLLNAPFFYSILRAWKSLRDSETVAKWIKEHSATSAKLVSSLTKAMVAQSVGAEPRYSMGRVLDEDLYDLPAFAEACRHHLSAANFNSDARQRVEVVLAGITEIIAQRTADDSSHTDR